MQLVPAKGVILLINETILLKSIKQNAWVRIRHITTMDEQLFIYTWAQVKTMFLTCTLFVHVTIAPRQKSWAEGKHSFPETCYEFNLCMWFHARPTPTPCQIGGGGGGDASVANWSFISQSFLVGDGRLYYVRRTVWGIQYLLHSNSNI